MILGKIVFFPKLSQKVKKIHVFHFFSIFLEKTHFFPNFSKKVEKMAIFQIYRVFLKNVFLQKMFHDYLFFRSFCIKDYLIIV